MMFGVLIQKYLWDLLWWFKCGSAVSCWKSCIKGWKCLTLSSSLPLVAEIVPVNHGEVIMETYHSSYYVSTLIATGVTYGTSNLNRNGVGQSFIIMQLGPSIIRSFSIAFAHESPRWLFLNRMKSKCWICSQD